MKANTAKRKAAQVAKEYSIDANVFATEGGLIIVQLEDPKAEDMCPFYTHSQEEINIVRDEFERAYPGAMIVCLLKNRSKAKRGKRSRGMV